MAKSLSRSCMTITVERDAKTSSDYLVMYQQLIGKDFDEEISMKAAKIHPNDLEKAVNFILNSQSDPSFGNELNHDLSIEGCDIKKDDAMQPGGTPGYLKSDDEDVNNPEEEEKAPAMSTIRTRGADEDESKKPDSNNDEDQTESKTPEGHQASTKGGNSNKRQIIAEAHSDVIQTIKEKLSNAKDNKMQYKLLSLALQITGHNIDGDLQCKHTFTEEANNFKFTFRLDFNFDKWMWAKSKYIPQFQNELAEILQMNPKDIALSNFRKGSTIFTVNFRNAWHWYKQVQLALGKLDNTAIDADNLKRMKAEDQIQVKYKDEWYNATIVDIHENLKGKQFSVRYNPSDSEGSTKAKNPFWINTEWFKGKYEESRIGFPYQLQQKNDQGERVWVPWLKIIDDNCQHICEANINDHLFVNFPNHGWRRSKVIDRVDDDLVMIKVQNLTEGDTMKLWQNRDENKVDFREPYHQYHQR